VYGNDFTEIYTNDQWSIKLKTSTTSNTETEYTDYRNYL